MNRYTVSELATLGGALHGACLHAEDRCRMAAEAGDQDTLSRMSDAWERLSDFYWSISTEYNRRTAELVRCDRCKMVSECECASRPKATESVAAWQRRTGRKVYGGGS
jgi:hypothetical protein